MNQIEPLFEKLMQVLADHGLQEHFSDLVVPLIRFGERRYQQGYASARVDPTICDTCLTKILTEHQYRCGLCRIPGVRVLKPGEVL